MTRAAPGFRCAGLRPNAPVASAPMAADGPSSRAIVRIVLTVAATSALLYLL